MSGHLRLIRTSKQSPGPTTNDAQAQCNTLQYNMEFIRCPGSWVILRHSMAVNCAMWYRTLLYHKVAHYQQLKNKDKHSMSICRCPVSICVVWMQRTDNWVIGPFCAVVIAQIAHGASESILCHDGWRCGSSQNDLGEHLFLSWNCSKLCCALNIK